jgi:hypothetical protein
VVLFLGAAGLSGVGCGAKQAEQPVFRLTGRVTFETTPCHGAQIVLRPANTDGWEGPYPNAVANANGEFTISTYKDGDGAPAGEYFAVIIWKKSSATSAGRDRESRDDDPSLIPEHYSDPQSTLFPVRVVDADTNPPLILNLRR